MLGLVFAWFDYEALFVSSSRYMFVSRNDWFPAACLSALFTPTHAIVSGTLNVLSTIYKQLFTHNLFTFICTDITENNNVKTLFIKTSLPFDTEFNNLEHLHQPEHALTKDFSTRTWDIHQLQPTAAHPLTEAQLHSGGSGRILHSQAPVSPSSSSKEADSKEGNNSNSNSRDIKYNNKSKNNHHINENTFSSVYLRA